MKTIQYIKKITGRSRKRLLGVLAPKIDPYASSIDSGEVSKGASKAAENIRGTGHPPSLMIYGVTTRSGTNYIANLLSYHPDIDAWPNQVWEVPFLRNINHILDFEKEFFRNENLTEKMEGHDILALFGASFIGYLHSFVSPDKVMLVKEPNVNYLVYFPIVFPNEQLILVLRDGRDVVSSTMKSWPKVNFSKVCQRWSDSAELMLQFYSENKRNNAYQLIKYEDVVADPEKFINSACQQHSLDVSRYPFDKLEYMPVIGSSVASQKDGSVSWDHVEKPHDFNPVGRWHSWSEQQKKTFKKIAGKALLDAGYCSDLDW